MSLPVSLLVDHCVRLLSPFLLVIVSVLFPFGFPLSPFLSPFSLVIVSVLSPFCFLSSRFLSPFLLVIVSVLSPFCFLLFPFLSPFLLVIVSALSSTSCLPCLKRMDLGMFLCCPTLFWFTVCFLLRRLLPQSWRNRRWTAGSVRRWWHHRSLFSRLTIKHLLDCMKMCSPDSSVY